MYFQQNNEVNPYPMLTNQLWTQFLRPINVTYTKEWMADEMYSNTIVAFYLYSVLLYYVIFSFHPNSSSLQTSDFQVHVQRA